MIAECPTKRYSIHAGHGPIGDYEVHCNLQYLGEGVLAVPSQHNLVAGVFKKQSKRMQRFFIVFDEKDCRHIHIHGCESANAAPRPAASLQFAL